MEAYHTRVVAEPGGRAKRTCTCYSAITSRASCAGSTGAVGVHGDPWEDPAVVRVVPAVRVRRHLLGVWLLGGSVCAACAASHEPEPATALAEAKEGGAWVMLEDGDCVYIPPDEWKAQQAEAEERARRDFQKQRGACAKGDGFSCRLAAYAYEEGHGTSENQREAAKYRQRAARLWDAACQQGRLDECAALGAAYVRGEGVKQDTARGRELQRRANQGYRAACDGGDGDACHSLGTQFILGAGLVRSREEQQKHYARAASLREKRCDADEWDACRGLALQMSEGEGIPRDRDAAQRLFEKSARLAEAACTAGDPAACDYAERMRR